MPWDRLADVEFVVLFGSQQRGRNQPHSDVDLAVMPRPGANPNQVGGALMAALHRSDVDLTWLPNASWLLLWEVAQGQLVFERRPGACSAWRNYAWQRWADRRIWQERDRRYAERYMEGDWRLNRDLVQRK
ncbi:MAG: type VII toxin-antitoxin system MntA family adenylyltransferase antitoxin [Candidatus Xenobia bacterium]